MRMKSILFIVLSLMLVMSGSAFAAEKVITWKLVVDFPEADLTNLEVAPRFAKWVEQESKGRMKIKVYSGGQLVPPSQSFDNLRAGTFQMLSSCGAYHGGKVPVANAAFILPLGPRSSDDHWRLHFEYGVKELLGKAYLEHGVRYLSPTPWSGLNILSKKPIRTFADFKGMKIRTSGLQAVLWKEVGASTVFIPGGELYLALQQGVVDAATWSNPAVDAMKLGEVTKYMIGGYPLPPGSSFCSGNGCLLVNEKAYQKLPDDLKRIIDRLSLQYGLYCSMLWREWDDQFFSGGDKARGMETIGWSKEDTDKLRKLAMEKIWPKAASKDKRCATYVEMVRKMLKDQGVIQ